MIRHALILAAGRGRQVGEPGVPNCLTPLGGVPLILRTLRVLKRAGVSRVGIAVGWQGARLRDEVEALRGKVPDLPEEISYLENTSWRKPNGLSVLAARTFVEERTLLVMADQIAAPRLVEALARSSPEGSTTILAVDRDLSRVFDFDDATKVLLSRPDGQPGGSGAAARGSMVVSIGKQIATYDAVSAGLFVMSPSLMDCLADLREPSLTEGVQEAARRGLVAAYDVGGALWQDVDAPEMRLHAEWLLRVYGDELDRPAVHGVAPSAATDTMALVAELLAEKDAPGYTLFNPGPVMTSARVKASLVHHDVCHRDEDYRGVVRRLQDKLRRVFGGWHGRHGDGHFVGHPAR
jgi:choline kinase